MIHILCFDINIKLGVMPSVKCFQRVCWSNTIRRGAMRGTKDHSSCSCDYRGGRAGTLSRWRTEEWEAARTISLLYSRQIRYLRLSFSPPLLFAILTTQIRGHTAGSFPLSPLQFVPCFDCEKMSALSSLDDVRRTVLTHAISFK